MISQELYNECLEAAFAESADWMKKNPGFFRESLGPGWLRHQLMKRNIMIKEQIAILRKEAEDIRENLGAKLKQITDLESSCQHSWAEPKLIVQRIDYDCGFYGGNYNERHWERECINCGKTDRTYREALQRVPDFGNHDGKIDLSNFGW